MKMFWWFQIWWINPCTIITTIQNTVIFGKLNLVIGAGQWYGDTESNALKYICEIFGNIWLLYPMKLFLGLLNSLVDT